jgi:hypothetical protein
MLGEPHKVGQPFRVGMQGDVRLAFGTDDRTLVDLLTTQLCSVLRGDPAKPFDIAVLNAALDLMVAIGPKDPTEALVAVQMAAAHAMAMDCAKRATWNMGKYLEAGTTYAALSGKLMRTFAVQLEALNRGRGKGVTQRVVVERVNVEPGGQAVVGAVATPGGRGA